MKKIFLMTILALAFAGVQAAPKDVKSAPDTLIVTTTPIMRCQACANKIKQSVRFVKGTKNIVTSVPDQRVTIIHDGSKATFDDYVAAFKKVGFDIKKTTRK